MRQAAIKAVAGDTDPGRRADPRQTEALKRRRIVQTPKDLGIDPAQAYRSLLAADSLEDLVKWSKGRYQIPGKFL